MTVISLFPNQSISEGLRNIADDVDSGDLPDDGCTVILGKEVFHLGCASDEQAATDAVFNMTMGIHRLMKPIFDEE